jgi:hypothetical protein
MWVLKGKKGRDSNILHQFESRLYTLTEMPTSPQLIKFINFLDERLPHKFNTEEVFVAPNIPLDKFSNALSSYAIVNANEKILSLIDTSGWDDGKEGILLTTNRAIWKSGWSSPNYINYHDINDETKEIPGLSQVRDSVKLYLLLQEIGEKYTEFNI